MADILGDLNFALQSFVTWMMTLVLILLAAFTIIGFAIFIMNRKLNKTMFIGFVLFTVCALIFTKVFGYRMEFFNAGISSIALNALWYLWFLFKGIPVQPPPENTFILILTSLPVIM